MIGEAVADLLAGPRPARPEPQKGGLRLEVEFKWHHPAETLSYLDGFERTGEHTVAIDVDDHLAIARTLQFLGNYKLVPDL